MEQMFRLQTKTESALILSTKEDALALAKERNAKVINATTNEEVRA